MFPKNVSRMLKFNSNVIRITGSFVHYGLFLERQEVQRNSKHSFGFDNIFPKTVTLMRKYGEMCNNQRDHTDENIIRCMRF
jgi:hypothetical protein